MFRILSDCAYHSCGQLEKSAVRNDRRHRLAVADFPERPGGRQAARPAWCSALSLKFGIYQVVSRMNRKLCVTACAATRRTRKPSLEQVHQK
jgi:hypothetical protein